MDLMEFLIVILLFIVVIGVLNEKLIHMQGDIALVLFSLIISGILLAVSYIPGLGGFAELTRQAGSFGFKEYLLNCVLCFMLFSGAGKVNLRKFRQNIRAISLLALLSTIISSAVYGVLFWAAARVFSIGIDFWTCVLLGCIVSPTDPIAATGILNKLGLSKNVSSVIESESLFNDGTGVALFVFVKSIVSHSGESSFLLVMLKEIVGAVAVALLVSILLFRLMKLTRDPTRHILISLLAVALTYAVCEKLGFSGVIASVVCGMYLAYKRSGINGKLLVADPDNLYRSFWEAVEGILNSVLFVMIGLSVLNISFSGHLLFIVPATVCFGLMARFAGVAASSLLTGRSRIPGSYDLAEFTLLMTWSALKGGLSLALAMSTKEFLDPDIYLIVLNAAYVTIFFTVIVQGLTTRNVYTRIEKHKAIRIKKQSEASV